jgi:hypothetical protein
MSDRLLALGSALTIAVAFAAAVAQAGPETERFALDPNVPRVTAKASVERDALTLTVTGAPAGARVAAEVDRLACAPGGRRAGSAVADAAGRASWTARGALPARVRDGRHVLAVSVGATTLACGSIPAGGRAAEPPRQRHWGPWSFARHFID